MTPMVPEPQSAGEPVTGQRTGSTTDVKPLMSRLLPDSVVGPGARKPALYGAAQQLLDRRT